MSGAKYSQEEIEKKRLLALQRKKEAVLKKQTYGQSDTSKKTENPQNHSNKNEPQRSVQQVLSNFKYNASNNTRGQKTSGWQQNQHNYQGAIRSPKPNNRYQAIGANSFFNRKPVVTLRCSMISNERFCTEMSSFIPAIVELFKSIPTKFYDMKTRNWHFHIKDYETVIEKLTSSGSGIQVVGLPKSVLQVFKKNLNSNSDIPDVDLSKIDPELTRILMPFQRDGICFGISRNGRCMIADDMGLGKTIQALGIAHHYIHDWPLLIVAPSSVRYQWSEAIHKFLPSIPAHYIHQFKSSKDLIDHEKITITSYDLLVRAVDTFERHTFGFVILDESHFVKNNRTARYKAVHRIICQAGHVVLLSGTPALSRPAELYSQISLIMPNFMGYQEYGVRYCNAPKDAFAWSFLGSSNTLELQLLLKATCMIRRLKSDVLSQLPAKIRQVILLDPALIKAGTKKMRDMSMDLECTTLNGAQRHNALLKFYTESSFVRLKAVCNYISDLLESRKKCLIYAHHQNVLNAIADIAESMSIRYIRIDGKTKPEVRKDLVDEFQANSDCIVAILSITAANAGVTLTAAHLVVFAELFWNPGILAQAEDRVHRIGQDNSVLIQYLVAKNTVDDYLWPLIQKKMNVLNEVGLEQNFSLREAEFTEQATEDGKSQQKIDCFLSIPAKNTGEQSYQSKDTTNCVGESNGAINDADEIRNTLEINAEDFDNCDWAEIM